MADTPLQAIRKQCRLCSGNSVEAIKDCKPIGFDCPLHPFRFGSNPNRQKRVMSVEQREAAIERLRIAREGTKKQGNEGEISDDPVSDVRE